MLRAAFDYINILTMRVWGVCVCVCVYYLHVRTCVFVCVCVMGIGRREGEKGKKEKSENRPEILVVNAEDQRLIKKRKEK